jgi:hypothetical protein
MGQLLPIGDRVLIVRYGFAWGAALTVALLRNPEAPIAGGDGRDRGRRAQLRVVDVLPRLPDYVRCFELMAIRRWRPRWRSSFVTGTTGRSSARVIAIGKPIGGSCSRTAAVTVLRRTVPTIAPAAENARHGEKRDGDSRDFGQKPVRC